MLLRSINTAAINMYYAFRTLYSVLSKTVPCMFFSLFTTAPYSRRLVRRPSPHFRPIFKSPLVKRPRARGGPGLVVQLYWASRKSCLCVVSHLSRLAWLSPLCLVGASNVVLHGSPSAHQGESNCSTSPFPSISAYK